MTEAMEKALHDSPDGVSVITSCSKGEESLELDHYYAEISYDTPGVKGSGADIYGGFFLSMLHAASIAGGLAPEKKLPEPGDNLPVERMTSWMKRKLGEVVRHAFPERTQTVKATIKQRAEPIPFNGAEPVPPRFDFPTPPPSADPKEVTEIIHEIQLPPIKAFRVDAPPPSISDVIPFSKEALKDYMAGELKPGDKPNDFQQAILNAIEEMRKQGARGSGTELPEEFGGDTSDKAKAELRNIQEVPARVEAIMQDTLDNLDSVFDMKEKQTKRWQATYEYVVAQVKLRMCYANQYNLALANVSRRKAARFEGRAERLSPFRRNEARQEHVRRSQGNVQRGRKSLNDIIKKHPKTPWAVMAKTDRTVAIGLHLIGSSVANGFR